MIDNSAIQSLFVARDVATIQPQSLCYSFHDDSTNVVGIKQAV